MDSLLLWTIDENEIWWTMGFDFCVTRTLSMSSSLSGLVLKNSGYVLMIAFWMALLAQLLYISVHPEFLELLWGHFRVELWKFCSQWSYVTSQWYWRFFSQLDYGKHIAHSLDAQFLEHCIVQHMKTVPCDLLIIENVCE